VTIKSKSNKKTSGFLEIKSLLSQGTRTSPSSDLEAFYAATEALSARAHAELARERDAAALRRLEKLVDRSAVPEEFASASLEPVDDLQKRGFDAAKNFLDSTGFGLVLFGDTGRGKTHAACALLNRLIAAGRQPGLFVTALEFCALIDSSRKWDAEVGEYQTFQKFCDPTLLVIDELYEACDTPYKRGILTSLVDARYRKRLKTIITSNLDFHEIERVIGPRSFDRLLSVGGSVVEMRGPSLRSREF
jgi:DNA replication protein DnaC